MAAERAEQGHDVAPHQWLAAGQAEFLDAEPDEGGAHAVELFEGQELGFRQKNHLFRHAIDAAEVAAVGDRYAQICDGSSKRVDHALLVRTADYFVNMGRGREMSPPIGSWLSALSWRLLGKPVPENLLFGVVGPSQDDLIDLRVLFEVGDCNLDPAPGFCLDELARLRLQTRTVLDAPFQLQPGEADHAPPSVPRLDRGGILELYQVLNDPYYFQHRPKDKRLQRRELLAPTHRRIQLSDRAARIPPVPRNQNSRQFSLSRSPRDKVTRNRL